MDSLKVFQYRFKNSFCYAVICRDSGESIIIDPGYPVFLEAVKKESPNVKAVCLTHQDPASSGAARDFANCFDAPVIAFENGDININARYSATIGKMNVEFFHTPGHSQDSVCIRVGQNIFTGHTLGVASLGYCAGTESITQMYKSIMKDIPEIAESRIIWPSFDKSVEAFRMLQKVFPENKEYFDLEKTYLSKRNIDSIKISGLDIFNTDMDREKRFNLVYKLSDSRVRNYLAAKGYFTGSMDDLRAFSALQYFYNGI